MAISLRHLEILYGVAGAREKFEDLTVHLIRTEYPAAERVRVIRGDGGIDTHEGKLADPGGVDIFQVKYFPTAIAEAQRGQIRESFTRARDNPDFKVKSWTLCLPIDMGIEEKKWFDAWADKQTSSGIEIRPVWGATQLERLLMKDENRDVRETFFQQEHMQLARTQAEHLRQILDEIIDRVPKPAPLVLEASLDQVDCLRCYPFNAAQVIVELTLRFKVRNSSDNQTAQDWTVNWSVDSTEKVYVSEDQFPRLGDGRPPRLVSNLLPLQTATLEAFLGIKVYRRKSLIFQAQEILNAATVTFRAVSHNNVSPWASIRLREKIEWPKMLVRMEQAYLIDIKDNPGTEPP
jgi:hypothetical protein